MVKLYCKALMEETTLYNSASRSGRVGSGVGKHVVIMLASPAELGLGLSLAISDDKIK